MDTLSLAELRQNPTHALNAVEDGRTFIITRHKRPIAKLVPMSDHLDLQIIPARTPRHRPRIKDLPNWPRKSLDEITETIEWVKGDR
ncbi:prevent-host-death family protein [Trueperella bonasi]|uniref:Antitoxin n=1 Tax=Trueperella bonasi TaxID=312286 RepID=A0ABT9NIJ3_9ACTO|nr:type II toxin-antitoxin system Phd/YefM family antitoxin [Trueperella bonasi]MDP9806848.1 prevent-host-death family protein [Trueperella bonasi]